MSNNVSNETYETRREYYLREKCFRIQNQITFLKNCIEEQVLPRSAPRQIHSQAHPFTNAARAYLEDGVNTLHNKATVLKSRCRQHLPGHLVERLQHNAETHRQQLENKLSRLCTSSSWKTAGNTGLITNLSNRPLRQVETEALSLGLKFDTGKSSNRYLDDIIRNTKYNDSDIDKGFKQGFTTCLSALAGSSRPVIPRRYLVALRDLARNSDIVISPSDKGGGVIILDRTTYESKMNELLSDNVTYHKETPGRCKKKSEKFNKEARRLLRRSEKGKQLLHLLEEKPRPAQMKGLPMIHKEGIPMRPITSGIGSAPHRLAKCLAKPLSAALGIISCSHLKKSADLLDRLKDVDVRGMKMASFDVK